jgi:flavorubredoxin
MEESRKPEHAIVIFDSKFGNTAKIAKSLASGLQMAGVETACLSISDVEPQSLANYDLIAMGAPTQAFSASRPMKDFLNRLGETSVLKGKRGFAFDTRLDSRFSGSASKFIEKKLAELGMEIVRDRQSAIVGGSEGPLEAGEMEAFERIGFDMGSLLARIDANRSGR